MCAADAGKGAVRFAILLGIDSLALLLRNQGLSEPLPDADTALERVVAVQTQYAQSLEIALAARSKKNVTGWEARALGEKGHLHKSWGLRRTLHAHGPEGWALVHGALGAGWHDRYHRRMPAFHPERDFRRIEAAILDALAGGPKTRTELHALVPEVAGLPMAGWGVDVMGAAFCGALRVVGRGSEQRFALATPPVGGCLEDLLRAYLRGYGPATVKDFGYWVGLPLRDVAPTFANIRGELQEFAGGFVLADAPDEASQPPRAVLLAKFDPLTMGHADKSRWLLPADHPRVFRKAAQVEAVVLLRGRAAATWRVARTPKRATLTVEPFRTLRPPEHAAIERVAFRLGKSIGWGETTLRFEAS